VSPEEAVTSVKTPSCPSANTATGADDPSVFRLNVGVRAMDVLVGPVTVAIVSPLKAKTRTAARKDTSEVTRNCTLPNPRVSDMTTSPGLTPVTVAPKTVAMLELALTKFIKAVTSALKTWGGDAAANVKFDSTLIVALS